MDSLPPDTIKLYVDDVYVYKVADMVYMTDPDSDRLRLTEYRDYVAQQVRRVTPTPSGLRHRWRTPVGRSEITEKLRRRGVDLTSLSDEVGLPQVDAFDVLVHLAWREPVLTRRERARRVRRDHADFFLRYQGPAREVLDLLLERYAEYGVEDLADLRSLELEPLSQLGTVKEIAGRLDDAGRLRDAVARLQELIYAA